ncbi:hypothetical protein [Enterococcus sp. 5H]|uniref:hypothetical protein n=1 Tax=Enterococcus sp. 5H TaxID=1229490 RepID=UPI0023024E1B|nr:hypothetical protein [Enterococcus sp. 5H]MDA9472064.1 hypothetical protein [Enterococcus sp. 5H]
MFNLFKKKQPEPETQLTDHVPVDNLKAYVVRGYETEKRLTAELDMKNQTIKELESKLEDFDALEVILSEKQEEIWKLEFENQKIEQLKTKIDERNRKIDDYAIKVTELKKSRESYGRYLIQKTRSEVKQSIINRIEQHKGNLSKAKAIEIVEGES